MTTYKKIIGLSLSAAFTVGALMTTPEMPSQNSGGLDLPAAIASAGEDSPTITRVGEVTEIEEADNITVSISGSPTLVQASFLFPQYQPVLGDRVIVQKTDAQWLVLGTLSGPINSLIPNATFEDGDVGSIPTGWTLVVSSSAGGTPVFTKEFGPDVSGRHYGKLFCSTAGAGGTSAANLVSTLVPARENQKWAMAYYLLFAYVNLNAASVSQSGDTRVEGFIQFFNDDGVFISETSANFIYLGANMVNRLYLRTTTLAETNFIVAPADTASARMKIAFQIVNSANSLTNIGLDYMVLRSVG